MNTVGYMGALKRRLGIESDYALAKALCVTKQTVSRYAQGKGYFDDEVAIRAARILEIDPMNIIVATHVERARTPEEQEVWRAILEKISKSFNDLLSGWTGPERRRAHRVPVSVH